MEVNEQLKASWREEQYKIASQVIIPIQSYGGQIDLNNSDVGDGESDSGVSGVRAGSGVRTVSASDGVRAANGVGNGRYKYMLPPTHFNTITACACNESNDGQHYADTDDIDFNDEHDTILIGGVDVSFPKDEHDDAIAVYVILKYKFPRQPHHERTTPASPRSSRPSRPSPSPRSSLSPRSPPPTIVYRSHKFYKLTTPYLPSYLAFREITPLQSLIADQIQSHPHWKPHVILVDGNGRWHERRAGIACFVGVRCGIATVGVGKTFYCLDYGHDDDGTREDIGGEGGSGNKGGKEENLKGVREGIERWYEHFRSGSFGSFETIGDCHRGLMVDSIPIPQFKDSNDDKDRSDCPSSNSSNSNNASTEEILAELHKVANGLAIPMQDSHGEVLAYALVGHGGHVGPKHIRDNHSGKKRNHVNQNMPQSSLSLSSSPSSSDPIPSTVPMPVPMSEPMPTPPQSPQSHQSPASHPKGGTKNPIYISVGHNISLEDAVALCAHVSIARIPEPVREADLYGRQVLRELEARRKMQRK